MEIDIDALVQQWKAQQTYQKDSPLEPPQNMEVDADALPPQWKGQQTYQKDSPLELPQNMEAEFRRKLEWFIAAREAGFPPVMISEWLRHDTWTVQEGLILLSGYNPRYMAPLKKINDYSYLSNRDALHLSGLEINDDATQAIFQYRKFAYCVPNFEYSYNCLIKIWNSGQHDQPRYAPDYFIKWALSRGFEVPWLEWATLSGDYVDKDAQSPASADKPVSTTERYSLLKIIIGMAINGYGYHPTDKKSPIPKEIALALQNLGMPVSDDTIRKYLQEATKTVLPPE